MFLKFCTSDRFIAKYFTPMNSNIEHIHSYAKKYHHFLVKFQYYRDTYQRQEQYILFFDNKKVLHPTEKVEKFILNFSSQLIVEDDMYK